MANNPKPGVWKKDPRGVEYISFTMPSESELEGDIVVFNFTHKGEQYTATTNSTNKILGIIVLMDPKQNED